MFEIDDDLRWLRYSEAARILNVSRQTVSAWLYRGDLEGFKLDGVVRVDRLSIERLTKTHRYADKRRHATIATRQWAPNFSRPRGTTV